MRLGGRFFAHLLFLKKITATPAFRWADQLAPHCVFLVAGIFCSYRRGYTPGRVRQPMLSACVPYRDGRSGANAGLRPSFRLRGLHMQKNYVFLYGLLARSSVPVQPLALAARAV